MIIYSPAAYTLLFAGKRGTIKISANTVQKLIMQCVSDFQSLIVIVGSYATAKTNIIKYSLGSIFIAISV